jgi:hypothetical protein
LRLGLIVAAAWTPLSFAVGIVVGRVLRAA